MGFLTILRKNDKGKMKDRGAVETGQEALMPKSTVHIKGKPDTNGLYPSELIMLSFAKRYKTNETNFPAYLGNMYGIDNPKEMLKTLQANGYIEIGSAIDVLASFKVSELKEMASPFGIEAKGKKQTLFPDFLKWIQIASPDL